MGGTKGQPATYQPVRVSCRHCHISWMGNENGKRRHEVQCLKMRTEAAACHRAGRGDTV